MSKEELTELREEIFKSMRELEKKLLETIAIKIAQISDDYEKYNQKIDFITVNNRQLIESVISEKINIEKLNALDSFKNKTDGILISHEIRINNINKDITKMKNKYDRVIEDNLLVPGLIGIKCQFNNVKEYIQSVNSEISRLKYEKDQLKIETKDFKSRLDNLFKQMISISDNSVDRSKVYINEQILGNKKQFELKMNEFNEKSKDLRMEIHQIKTEIEEQANNIKLESEKISNFTEQSKNVEENIVKINNTITDMTMKTNYEINNLYEKNKKTEKKITDLKNELGRIKVMTEIRNKTKNKLSISQTKEIMDNNHITMENTRKSQSNIESINNKNFSEKKNLNEKRKKLDTKEKKYFYFDINNLTKEEIEQKNNKNKSKVNNNRKLKNEEKITNIKLNKIRKKIKNKNNNNDEEKTEIIISEESFQDNNNDINYNDNIINQDDISNIKDFYKTIIDTNKVNKIPSRNEDIISINPNFRKSIDNTNNNTQDNYTNTFKEPEKTRRRISQIKFDLKNNSLKKKTYEVEAGEKIFFPKIYFQSQSNSIDNPANIDIKNNIKDKDARINNINNDNDNDITHSSASEYINNNTININNNKKTIIKENNENSIKERIYTLDNQNDIDLGNMSSRKESVKNLKENIDKINNLPSYRNSQRNYSRNNDEQIYSLSNNNKNSDDKSPKTFDEDRYLLANFKKTRKKLSLSKSNTNKNTNFINNMNINSKSNNNNNLNKIFFSQRETPGGINLIGKNEEKLNSKNSIDDNIYLEPNRERKNNIKLESFAIPSPKSFQIKKRKNKLQGISSEAPLKISAAFGRTAYTFIDKNNNKKLYSIQMRKIKPENEKFDVYLGNPDS